MKYWKLTKSENKDLNIVSLCSVFYLCLIFSPPPPAAWWCRRAGPRSWAFQSCGWSCSPSCPWSPSCGRGHQRWAAPCRQSRESCRRLCWEWESRELCRHPELCLAWPFSGAGLDSRSTLLRRQKWFKLLTRVEFAVAGAPQDVLQLVVLLAEVLTKRRV